MGPCGVPPLSDWLAMFIKVAVQFQVRNTGGTIRAESLS